MKQRELQECTKNVIESLISSFDNELYLTPKDEIDGKYWHFKWNDSESLEQNMYQFHDLLSLYGSFCRQWEEHHNGSGGVVGRVRDEYLMPKIREFIETMKQ